MSESSKKDLLLLVPDKNTHFALKGALPRHEALGIRPISFEFLVHSGRDGGVRTTGAALAALKRNQFHHLLMIFDHEGCGAESMQASDLIAELERQLAPRWGNAAGVIVIEPEVDVWMWGGDNILAELLKWSGNQGMRDRLRAKGFEFDANDKPVRPKEALEEILAAKAEPRSSSLYEKIASRLSLQRCKDPAFIRLQKTLQHWFPQGDQF